MSSVEFRWGIISTGKIATCFVKDILLDPKTRGVHDVTHKLTAVGSRSIDSAQQFIKELAGGDSTVKAYGSYDEVFANKNVDGVYIGTPHTLHYANARAALLAKKHVLLEKPATCNAAELRSLVSTAQEQGVFFMEAMWTRFLPVAQEFKRVVEEGRLGDPITMTADLSLDFDIQDKPKTHRIIAPELGGGGLLDLGPYPMVWVIMALYEYPTNRTTRPAHITGSMVKTPLTGVDASTSWTLSFSPSKDTRSTLAAQAILSTNIHVKQHSPAVVIRYQHGVIEIPSPPYAPKGFTVTYFDPNKDSETKKFPVDWQGGGWHFQADEVARCVRDGKLESDLWGWNKSLLEMDVFDEVRRQGGYVFPKGIEQVV